MQAYTIHTLHIDVKDEKVKTYFNSFAFYVLEKGEKFNNFARKLKGKCFRNFSKTLFICIS